jgi:REP element-mobilizing transposase RayT
MDYSAAGVYFVTVCTQDRRCILSTISGEAAIPVGGDVRGAQITISDGTAIPVGGDVLDAPEVVLTQYGRIIEKYIKQLNNFYNYISIEKYVIMPNHIHILINVCGSGASGTSPPTKQHSVVPQFVSTLKRFCNKEIGQNIFQRSFHDHVVRDLADYAAIWQYIDNNPLKWQLDKYYTEV